MENQPISYTYLLIGEDGRYYLGSHKTKEYPDNYMGSFTDTSFKPIRKIILRFFESYQSAYTYEGYLQRLNNVIKNPNFVNKSINYSKHPTEDVGHKDSAKIKISVNRKGKCMGRDNPAFGKKVVLFNDEHILIDKDAPLEGGMAMRTLTPEEKEHLRKINTNKVVKESTRLKLSDYRTDKRCFTNGHRNIWLDKGTKPLEGYRLGKTINYTVDIPHNMKPFVCPHGVFSSKKEYIKVRGFNHAQYVWDRLFNDPSSGYKLIDRETYIRDYLERE